LPQRSKAKKKTDVTERRRKRLLVPILLLLALGLAASIYLFRLHLQVHSAGGAQVQSFCAINEDFNCVTVANSEWSVFLGLPVALYGLEFYALALLGVLLSSWGVWRVKAWDSLVFVGVTLSLPICGVLAYISVAHISSICLVCMLMYGVSVLSFAILLVANRGRLGELLTIGPAEVLKSLGSPGSGLGMLLVLGLGVSQFFWLPAALGADQQSNDPPAGHEIWRTQQVSGATIGPKDAPVKIEEFTDFECPYCGKAHKVMMRLLERFPGKIHLVHRDYPLDHACNPTLKKPFHANACRAAIYARCAAQQDKYWPFEGKLFSNRDRLEAAHMKEYAGEAGIDVPALERCVTNPRTRQAVIKGIREGIERKVEGTPTFYINGERVVGMRPLSFWVDKVETLLKQKR
jgi:protein-disulfide isomerase/uncharacterized membrane protein